MDILVIALSINPRPLSALQLKFLGLIMKSRVDTAGDNQNAHLIISNYSTPKDKTFIEEKYSFLQQPRE